MKIIIIGAGQVGATLAENLANEDNDITVVDSNQQRLRELQDRLDIQTVEGSGSHPDVLDQAGCNDADMLIAVSNQDEINMVACQIAHTLFKTPTKIGRVRSSAYAKYPKLFSDAALPIDVRISPEKEVTKHLSRLIRYPGALQVMEFAEGKIQLVVVKAETGGPLIDQPISFLKEHMPSIQTRIAAIYRDGQAIKPDGNTHIRANDEVFFLTAQRDVLDVMSELRPLDTPYRRIIIAGGGNIGERLAQSLEKEYRVKIIERSPERCRYLSETLNSTIVLNGDASKQELLLEENIESTDVFCALTNNDEANIMSSMLAKVLGARTVMTIINNPAYVDIVQKGMIDIAISPQQTTISSLLSYIRRGDVVNVHSLRKGAAEALEAVAHGDYNSSKVVGRKISNIHLPEGATIGAIVRGDDIILGSGDVKIEAEDHVILFVSNKKQIPAVEQLFQVGLTFF
ncbi:Trk system potassium transporter TrkA [Marinomonas mediterranea]|jgi:K+ transport systems, NAD-binding component|uniref:Trk system potassium uptake protein TrkA n=1 Tax=Marinomonas mediterranea (strain ATCC 700492 / JCM 21426 / NBRC 103028 / MMB-1) TaxID=717774 RepID=F2JUI5_MARM1|nr:Trk system potassium transporter TrkA [Marinomonas mediterranea]ADZ89318.1 TrkA-N domain protein [Marinomonas mediterranea MMB-1]WCN11515.1 Trk system potassium transporter TrkA [Marinomonas mediterranea]WCN15585.1 Trk system potassium transporter TrkA [Marinomonas mediterranea MMB-1]